MLRTAVLESPELPDKNVFNFGGMGGCLPGLLIFYFNFTFVVCLCSYMFVPWYLWRPENNLREPVLPLHLVSWVLEAKGR